MSTTKRIYGLYGDDDDLMHGVKAFRDKGIEIAEVYTPFPVHGLDKAPEINRKIGGRYIIISEQGFNLLGEFILKDDIFFSFMRIFLKLIGLCLIFCM